MRVQLLGEMSGTRNGQEWPPRGSTVDLPDEEALRMCAQNMARPVVEVEESRAVVAPVEDVRVVDGSPVVPVAAPAVGGAILLENTAGTARGRRRT